MPVVHIIGNIGAGKTTLSNEMKEAFPEFKILSIDNYRLKYADGTKDGENLAWEKLLTDVQKYNEDNKYILLESSGTSWRIKYFPTNAIVYVDTPIEICSERIRKRGKTNVPWCYTSNPLDSIQPIQEKLDEKIRYYSYYYPKKLVLLSTFSSIKELITYLLNNSI